MIVNPVRDKAQAVCLDSGFRRNDDWHDKGCTLFPGCAPRVMEVHWNGVERFQTLEPVIQYFDPKTRAGNTQSFQCLRASSIS